MSNYSLLRMQHTSLQFNDRRFQQRHDVRELFMQGRYHPIKTGTEAAPTNDLHDFLKDYAKRYNHLIHFSRGNWVAIDRDIIKPGSVRRGSIFVADNKDLYGKMHDRSFPWVKFTHKNPKIGRLAIAAVHYATRGQVKGDPNYWANELYAKKLAQWMKQSNSKGAIPLAAGDFNIQDNRKDRDWAFGEPFTSMGDELGKHPGTGHGPIDGFVSYDRNKRVKAELFAVLRDEKMKMYTDHFVCRGIWRIRHLKI